MMSRDEDVTRGVAIVEQIQGFELFSYLAEMLSEGQPVPLNRLAAASSWPIHQVEAILRPNPGAEWDEERWVSHRAVLPLRTAAPSDGIAQTRIS
jgi:hypothetical protein